MNAPKIFSLPAVLVSVAVHVAVVGLLFSVGVPGSDVPEPPARNPVSEEPEKEPENKPAAVAEKTPAAEKEEPLAAGKSAAPAKAEPEKVSPGPKAVEIRIEPEAPAAPRHAPKAAAPKTSASVPEDDGKPAKTVTYTVKRGDTLTALARECGLTVAELAKLNGKSVKKLSVLKVGQRLKLPAKD
jgi:LysM repeat protein